MLKNIEHIVVLMLENRSFDNILGMLYPKSPAFNGLAGNESNQDANDTPFKVWNSGSTDQASMAIPSPDPGELWTDITTQIFGVPSPSQGSVANMSGFVKNYLSQKTNGQKAENIMHYFIPEQVPAISTLAKQFAVCDSWHASAPCQTWPNRFFVHTATANGYENNSPVHFPYEMPTIYNRFEDNDISNGWKIYFHDVPQTMTLARLWPHLEKFRPYEEFKEDAKNGNLPCYSFIEPRYFTDIDLPNDQHPPHVVTLGDQLIADVYNALRSGKSWEKTLLIITYDEHGSCYDHVPPPAATSPEKTASSPFNFDRYGVRVPAVIISPYIPPGTILRPAGEVPFDHTSIIATLRKRFDLGGALSDRDATAPDLEIALSLTTPDNLGPNKITALPYTASQNEIATAHAAPLNDMQNNLLKMTQHLPASIPDNVELKTFIQNHISYLKQEDVQIQAFADSTAKTAISFIKERLDGLFKSL